MKLSLYISVIRSDESIHVISGERTMFFGKVGNAYTELPDDYLNNAEVIDVFSSFCGMCIEAVL